MTPTPEQNAKRVPTPRSDAQTFIAGHQDWEGECVTSDFARALETELQQLRLAADGAVEGLQEQLDWLEIANHPEHCAKFWRPHTLAGSLMLGPNFTPLPCDCWIASAKKDATDRIATYRAAGEGAPNDTGTSKE